MVLEGLEGISIKTHSLVPNRALALPTTRNSMPRRNRRTIHSLLVLRLAPTVLPISHIYQQLISQVVVNTNQLTEFNLSLHPHPTPRINLRRRHLDHMSSVMATVFLLRLDQTQERSTQVFPQSYHIGRNHYLLYQPPNLHLQDRPIHRPPPLHHHFHQVEMHSLRMLPQRPHKLIRKKIQHLGTRGKESLIVRFPCTINCL